MLNAIDSNLLAEFQKELVGNWMNMAFGHDKDGMEVGGEDDPLSYNVMPLPETSDPDRYILKNFKYSERIKFNNENVNDTLVIAAKAPNRGGWSLRMLAPCSTNSRLSLLKALRRAN
jgi:hypothetical protein